MAVNATFAEFPKKRHYAKRVEFETRQMAKKPLETSSFDTFEPTKDGIDGSKAAQVFVTKCQISYIGFR